MTALRITATLAAGILAGLALSVALTYLWLCFGSARHTDGIIAI